MFKILNMKKIVSLCTAAAAMLLVLSSCDPFGGGTDTPQELTGVGYYLLNNGNWGANDASLGVLALANGQITSYAYKTVNGKALGDLAQDAIEYGSRLYVAVYGSANITVCNKKTVTLEKTLTMEAPDGGTLSPRHLEVNGGYLYVTYYEGYVGAIDTLTFSLKHLVKVGDNPEGIAYCDGKLYVANSGGMNYPDYGHTVSVINTATMAVENEIEVEPNPSKFAVDSNDNLFLLSWGNYGDTPAALQKIDRSTGTVTIIDAVKNPTDMAMAIDDQLLVLTDNDVVVYYTEGRYMGSLHPNIVEINNKYSISTDHSLGNLEQGLVFIGASDYINTGNLYVFDCSGNRYYDLETGGMNPLKVIPVSFTYTY